MSTRVIQRANVVRAKFEGLSATRMEKLVELAIAKTDERLSAYFEERLKAGEDPYPPPDHEVSLTVLDASDFASGNDPEAQGAWEHITAENPDGKLVIKRIHDELKAAGFDPTVSVDADRTVSVVVRDPQFERWFKDGHDVDALAVQNASDTFMTERTRPAVAPLTAHVKKHLLRELQRYEGEAQRGRFRLRESIALSGYDYNGPSVESGDYVQLVGEILRTLGVERWVTCSEQNYSTRLQCSVSSAEDLATLLAKLR